METVRVRRKKEEKGVRVCSKETKEDRREG